MLLYVSVIKAINISTFLYEIQPQLIHRSMTQAHNKEDGRPLIAHACSHVGVLDGKLRTLIVQQRYRISLKPVTARHLQL